MAFIVSIIIFLLTFFPLDFLMTYINSKKQTEHYELPIFQIFFVFTTSIILSIVSFIISFKYFKKFVIKEIIKNKNSANS